MFFSILRIGVTTGRNCVSKNALMFLCSTGHGQGLQQGLIHAFGAPGDLLSEDKHGLFI